MIRVLLIDHSAVARKVLAEALAREGDIEVVASLVSPDLASARIGKLRPDVVVLEVESQTAEGLRRLQQLAEGQEAPVVAVLPRAEGDDPSNARLLAAGAVAVVSRPADSEGWSIISRELASSIRLAQPQSALRARPAAGNTAGSAFTRVAEGPPAQRMDPPRSIIAIGASTGGTQAIESVLRSLPEDTPPTLIVQHMPEGFTTSFAARLNRVSAMRVREGRDGDNLERGVALVAPGNFHMAVEKRGGKLTVRTNCDAPVHHQRPSVDVLFESLADLAGRIAVGVLLTGMGTDGAKGLLALRRSGALTIAQDEKSSVVYGMPREAVKLEAACKVVPLSLIAQSILNAIQRDRGRSVEA